MGKLKTVSDEVRIGHRIIITIIAIELINAIIELISSGYLHIISFLIICFFCHKLYTASEFIRKLMAILAIIKLIITILGMFGIFQYINNYNIITFTFSIIIDILYKAWCVYALLLNTSVDTYCREKRLKQMAEDDY